MHTLAGSSAAVSRDHRSVGSLVKFNAEIVEPLNGLGRIADKFCEKFALCRVMSPAVSVNKMDRRRIVRLVRRLNTALRHHRVRVSYAEFCHDHGLCARVIRFDSRGSTGAASADNQNVNIVTHVIKIDVGCLDTAVRLQHLTKFVRNRFTFIGSDFKNGKLALFIIGMISREKIVLLLSRHARGFISDVCRSCRFDRFQRRFKFL